MKCVKLTVAELNNLINWANHGVECHSIEFDEDEEIKEMQNNWKKYWTRVEKDTDKCFTPNSNPYPLCIGNEEKDCKKCNRFENMDESDYREN